MRPIILLVGCLFACVVDARLRPEGNLPVEFVEQQFAQKVGPSTFDAFLEYGVAV